LTQSLGEGLTLLDPPVDLGTAVEGGGQRGLNVRMLRLYRG
jgi:hypothetical protein